LRSIIIYIATKKNNSSKHHVISKLHEIASKTLLVDSSFTYTHEINNAILPINRNISDNGRDQKNPKARIAKKSIKLTSIIIMARFILQR